MRRLTYSGRPYSVPRSKAATCAGFFSQCGSVLAALASGARRSSPATPARCWPRERAYRRVVSVSSAAMIQRAGLLAHARAGMDPELDAARAEVVALVRSSADVAQQSGEQRAVDLRVGCCPCAVGRPSSPARRPAPSAAQWMSRHSRMRLNDRKCSRQAFVQLAVGFLVRERRPRRTSTASGRRGNRIFSSSNCLCASSARLRALHAAARADPAPTAPRR